MPLSYQTQKRNSLLAVFLVAQIAQKLQLGSVFTQIRGEVTIVDVPSVYVTVAS